MISPECEVIQDLIQMGNKASRASVRLVTDHIRTCPDCRAAYEQKRGMFRHFSFRKLEVERDAEQRYLIWSLLSLAVMTSLICMIVNFAVENAFTWGWITVGAIACCIIPALVYVRAYSYRFLRAMGCFTVLALLLLGWIQIVVHDFMHLPGVWIWRVAIPLGAIWLAVLWIGVLVPFLRKRNGFFALSLIFLLAIPADIASTAIASAYTGHAFSFHWANAGLCLAAAIATGLCGMMSTIHRRKKR